MVKNVKSQERNWIHFTVRLARAVEYNDTIYAEGLKPHMTVLYLTLKNLIGKLQPRCFEEYGVPLPLLSISLWLESVVPDRVLLMGKKTVDIQTVCKQMIV